MAELLRGEVEHQAPESAQDPAELRTTQALNAEITSRNDLAENQERADKAASDAVQAQYARDMAAAEATRLRYEDDLRASAEARQQHERDMAAWQATVRACERGDRARCAASTPSRTPR